MCGASWFLGFCHILYESPIFTEFLSKYTSSFEIDIHLKSGQIQRTGFHITWDFRDMIQSK